MIAIVDYGRGNLGSVEKAFVRVGTPAVVTQEARVMDEADAVVLPGDGAFHDAMANLDQLGLMPSLRRALDGTRPFLGICLGYQLLFSCSGEFGEGRGLDVIPGVVKRFPAGRKIPHMGWNRVTPDPGFRLFDGIPAGAHFYFVHSYFVAGALSLDRDEGGNGRDARGLFVAGSLSPDSNEGGNGRDAPGSDTRWGWCEYGIRFAAALERGNIHATQFHPEKSQRWGIRMLENFAALVKDAR
jgi:imidazole glycerol-phosphate synthase subunit HisH